MGAKQTGRPTTPSAINRQARDAERSVLRLPVYDVDPAEPAEGAAWVLRGSTNKLKIRVAGVTRYVDLS